MIQGIRNEDIIREIEFMMGLGYQQAKVVFHLSQCVPSIFKTIRERGCKRRMSQTEAARITNAAIAQIKLVDEGD